MAHRKTERNQAIAAAAALGERLKAVADRFGLSTARVSKIVQSTVVARTITLAEDIKPTILAVNAQIKSAQIVLDTAQTLLNTLLNQ